MPNELVSLRLAGDVLERIDEHAAALSQYTGVAIGRAEVIRKFIVEGLDRTVPKKKVRKK